MHRVAAAGGAPTEIFHEKGVFRYPAFLPDGRRFLYTDVQPSDKSGIYISSLDGSENRRLLADRSAAVFEPSSPGSRAGYLLFVRENVLMAAAFDAAAAGTIGDAFPIAESVRLSAGNAGYAPFAVSGNGVLVYWTGNAGAIANQLAWYDRSGSLLSSFELGNVFAPTISPDATQVAFSRPAGTGGTDVWLLDLIRSAETRFTVGDTNFAGVWSPAGDRLAFASLDIREQKPGLFWKAANGSAEAELLVTQDERMALNQWSRDGRYLVYSRSGSKTGLDLWVLPLGDSAGAAGKPFPILQTQFNELFGQLSPDSRWMAYTSDESGQYEVYIRAFPAGNGKWKISTVGGSQPRWRADGKELFYRAADGKLTAVAVRSSSGPKPPLDVSAPVPLFDAHFGTGPINPAFEYDVTRDGKRFLVATSGATRGVSSPPLTVVFNWNASLRK